MSDHITLVGNIVGELEQRSTRNGGPIAAFRLAVGERRLDRERGEWVDGHTNYYNASVFGDLGAHALTSLRKGQRVVLTGRLRLREWENESKRGVSADVTVDAIGHDLRWGTSTFERAGKPSADAANPRNANKNGHIIEITEAGGRGDAETFDWDLFMVCGDEGQAGTYFAGWEGPVAPISCPDNVAFDSVGNLWISTDGQPGSIAKNDGLFRVPLAGKERGHLVQFLAVPVEAETCGPVIHDQDGSVFVAVQHPGEDGTWAEQHSYFPDYVSAGERPRRGEWRGPRPSVVQVVADR